MLRMTNPLPFRTLMLVATLTWAASGCKDSQTDTPAPAPKAPVVQTGAVSDITQTTAKVSVSLTDTGTKAVTQWGLVYGTAANPAVGSGTTATATGRLTGSQTLSLSGLAEKTTYHVRAFATSTVGTSYGSDISFTTLEQIAPPTLSLALAVPPDPTYAALYGRVVSPSGSALSSVKLDLSQSASFSPSTALPDPSLGTDGYFAQNLNNLTSGHTYYVRLRATDAGGRTSEKTIQFTTP